MPYLITLLDPAGDVPLAAAGDTVEEITLDGQSITQVQQPLRAVTPTPLNRGLRSRSLTLRVKRAPAASPAAALRAVFEHELLLGTRRGPALALQFSGAGGFTLTFSHAVLSHRGRAPGTTSTHEYSVQAGAYTIT
jgi:hypothetical protein